MVNDLLPRYYEANGDDPKFTVLRSIMIDGHEVAWMRIDGKVQFDITEQGREGEAYTINGVYCECDFTEFVGWEVKGCQRFNLDGKDKCLKRKVAMHLRHLELREEYRQQFAGESPWGKEFALMNNVGEIILNLMEKVKRDEFIGEDGSGANFWGGYFYLQTVAEITDQFVGHLWDPVYQLMRDEKIGLDGAVIKPYFEPPPPEWEEFGRFDVDGWIGVASLPSHRAMAREWKIEIFTPEGEEAYAHIPGVGLNHDPVFGPDVEDVARAEEKINELISMAKSRADE